MEWLRAGFGRAHDDNNKDYVVWPTYSSDDDDDDDDNDNAETTFPKTQPSAASSSPATGASHHRPDATSDIPAYVFHNVDVLNGSAGNVDDTMFPTPTHDSPPPGENKECTSVPPTYGEYLSDVYRGSGTSYGEYLSDVSKCVATARKSITKENRLVKKFGWSARCLSGNEEKRLQAATTAPAAQCTQTDQARRTFRCTGRHGVRVLSTAPWDVLAPAPAPAPDTESTSMFCIWVYVAAPVVPYAAWYARASDLAGTSAPAPPSQHDLLMYMYMENEPRAVQPYIDARFQTIFQTSSRAGAVLDALTGEIFVFQPHAPANSELELPWRRIATITHYDQWHYISFVRGVVEDRACAVLAPAKHQPKRLCVQFRESDADAFDRPTTGACALSDADLDKLRTHAVWLNPEARSVATDSATYKCTKHGEPLRVHDVSVNRTVFLQQKSGRYVPGSLYACEKDMREEPVWKRKKYFLAPFLAQPATVRNAFAGTDKFAYYELTTRLQEVLTREGAWVSLASPTEIVSADIDRDNIVLCPYNTVFESCPSDGVHGLVRAVVSSYTQQPTDVTSGFAVYVDGEACATVDRLTARTGEYMTLGISMDNTNPLYGSVLVDYIGRKTVPPAALKQIADMGHGASARAVMLRNSNSNNEDAFQDVPVLWERAPASSQYMAKDLVFRV